MGGGRPYAGRGGPGSLAAARDLSGGACRRGSPRDARSREVAKKSPAAHLAPLLPARWRGQVPAPGEAEPDRPGRSRWPGRMAVPAADGPPAATARAAARARASRCQGRPCRIRAGTSRAARRRRPPGETGSDDRGGDIRLVGGQVGVCLRPAPRGAELRVGGRGGGVPSHVPAVWAVRVGSGGDRPPGGADLLIGQVRAGGQPEDRERVHALPPGPNTSSRLPRPRGPGGGACSSPGGAGGGMMTDGAGAAGRLSGDGLGRATCTNVAPPRWM